MSALTPEEMLYDMQAHARSSVVHIEPKTVALWHELVGQLLCAAAFDVGLALVETDDAARADEREACAKVAERGYGEAVTGNDTPKPSPQTIAAMIRARGRR